MRRKLVIEMTYSIAHPVVQYRQLVGRPADRRPPGGCPETSILDYKDGESAKLLLQVKRPAGYNPGRAFQKELI